MALKERSPVFDFKDSFRTKVPTLDFEKGGI